MPFGVSFDFLPNIQADPALLRLPAPGLRGTWARAYSLLTRLVSEIGWDELLKTRSAVFVMEEEYRMQKSHADLHSASGSGHGLGSRAQGEEGEVVIHEDGTVVTRKRDSPSGRGADDDASTRAVHSPQESGTSEGQLGVMGGIPIIRVSTESEIERELAAAANGQLVDGGDGEGEGEHDGEGTVGKENGHGHGVASPRPVAAADEDAAESPRGGQDAFSFTNKRLCERWLDNLFMVLYEVRLDRSGTRVFSNDPVGLARLDHLSCGGGAFQDATCGLPQDWNGMGDSGGFGVAAASQGRSQGGVSAVSRDDAVCAKAMGEAVGNVRRGGGYHANDSDGHSGCCVSVCGLYRDDGEWEGVGHATYTD